MSFTTCSVTASVIAGLGTTPEERALDTDQFKAKFDEFATNFVAWFNATHIPELDASANTKLNLSGGTMSGPLAAFNTTSYATPQMRNITLSTASATGGGNGDVWIVYIP